MHPLIALLLSVACALARSPGHILNPGDPPNLKMAPRYLRRSLDELPPMIDPEDDELDDQEPVGNAPLNNLLRMIIDQGPAGPFEIEEDEEMPLQYRTEHQVQMDADGWTEEVLGPAYFMIHPPLMNGPPGLWGEPYDESSDSQPRYEPDPRMYQRAMTPPSFPGGYPFTPASLYELTGLGHSEGIQFQYRPDTPILDDCYDCPEEQEEPRRQIPRRPIPVWPWVRDERRQEFAQSPSDPNFASLMASIAAREPPVPPAPIPPLLTEPARLSLLRDVIDTPRQTRQNPTNSRNRNLVADNLERMPSGNVHEDNSFGRPEVPRFLAAESVFGIALVAAIGAGLAIAVFAFAYGWYTLSRRAKAAADVDYPAYGVTGPTQDSDDRKLAQSAHMYHYQHQKQQILAMERNGMEQRDGSVSDPESEEENEEGDYTVYECPGFATTGDMEVKNPLFLEDPTPSTKAAGTGPNNGKDEPTNPQNKQ